VLAFEPVATIAALLRETLALNDVDAVVNEHALGDRDGELTIFTFDGLPHGHASASDFGRSDARGHACRVRRIDDVLDGADFIKIDVEGYERDVLQGARRLLTAHRPALAFETNVECLRARNLSPRDVWNDVIELGYRVWRVEPNGRLRPQDAPPPDVNGDYIALSPRSP
jgi:FkbM family methyltransferase